MAKQLQEAYILAATRTPVGKAPRGALRHTRPDSLLAHVLKSVLMQAPQIDPKRIEDVIVGCAMPEYEQGMNVARIGLLLAGLPNTVAGMTINRFCSALHRRRRSGPGSTSTRLIALSLAPVQATVLTPCQETALNPPHARRPPSDGYFQRDMAKYDELNAVVLGVSLDTVEGHKAWCAKDTFSFKLLADPDHKVVDAYGVPVKNYGVMKFANRETFLISPDGKVVKVWEKVDPNVHSTEVLAEIAADKK